MQWMNISWTVWVCLRIKATERWGIWELGSCLHTDTCLVVMSGQDLSVESGIEMRCLSFQIGLIHSLKVLKEMLWFLCSLHQVKPFCPGYHLRKLWFLFTFSFLHLHSNLQICKSLTSTFMIVKIPLNNFCILVILPGNAKKSKLRGHYSLQDALTCRENGQLETNLVAMVRNLNKSWKCVIVALLNGRKGSCRCSSTENRKKSSS